MWQFFLILGFDGARSYYKLLIFTSNNFDYRLL